MTLGILVTWAVGTVAAYLLFDLSWEVSLVLGAVLVVSGPTVVGPLLDFIRPSKEVNSVLKWEGTFADPIGATLGVVVFNAVIAGHATAGKEIFEFLLAVVIGVGFGTLGGVLVLAWARWFKPSQSQAVTGTLMFVVAMVVCADLLRDDTGLITGLVMGAILVNRPPQGIEPAGLKIQMAKLTRAWRERIATLSTFLIGVLFIILSARVSPHQIGEIGWVSIAFIAVLVFVGRPLAVGLATLGSSLSMTRARLRRLDGAARDRRRSDLIDVCPRPLPGRGLRGPGPDPDHLHRDRRHRADLRPQRGPGGARARSREHRPGWRPADRRFPGCARRSGVRSRTEGSPCWSGPADDEYAGAAKSDGLSVYQGNPTEDASSDAPSELDEVQYALAVAEDEALNAMIATDLSEYFGRDRVFQLAAKDDGSGDFYTRTTVLFDDSATHEELLAQIKAGGKITVTEAPANGKKGTGDGAGGAADLPMFVLTPGKDLQ